MESEQLLRALFVPGKIHEDFTVSSPTFWEIVNLPEKGVESVRGYYALSGVRFRTRVRRLRVPIVYEWQQLTGERLTNDLEPVEAERRAT